MTISKTYVALQAAIIVGIICLAEVYVRYQGHEPGDLRPNWSNFRLVDSLIVYDDFHVDSTGILIANAEYFKAKGQHINRHGFRAPEFEELDSGRHKIMLIGDSFTWGLSATSLDSSFADLLAARTQDQIINTGIPIADPAQYEAIAKRYIPEIKPEKVLVMFYLGNDIMPEPRQVVPYKTMYYYTNAGVMMADDGAYHINSAQEAYDYYTKRKFFLVHPTSFAEKVIAKSALLSRLYSLRYRWEEKRLAENAIRDMSVTQKYLHSIIDICGRNNAALQIILIPEIKEADRNVDFFKKRYTGFFKDTIIAPYTYIPDGNEVANYVPYPDGHLNNAGHRFYAGKIMERLNQTAGRNK